MTPYMLAAASPGRATAHCETIWRLFERQTVHFCRGTPTPTTQSGRSPFPATAPLCLLGGLSGMSAVSPPMGWRKLVPRAPARLTLHGRRQTRYEMPDLTLGFLVCAYREAFSTAPPGTLGRAATLR